MFSFLCLLFGSFFVLSGSSSYIKTATDESVRFVAGSCVYQRADDQPLWEYMLDYNPDYVLLLGDNVYLDSKPTSECISIDEDLSCFNGVFDSETWYEALNASIQEYDILLNHDDFALYQNKTFMSNIPTIAIWDDHDYGLDNADAEFSYKNITKSAFFYFWQKLNSIPNDEKINNIINDITNDSEKGVFYYYDINKSLNVSNITQTLLLNGTIVNHTNFYQKEINIRVYGLDSRWYKLEENINSSNVNGTYDSDSMLGDIQKEWLESLLLNNSNANIYDIDFHIFLCGTNMLTHLEIGISGTERWPKIDKEWFLSLLNKTKITDKSVLLSGDIHYSIINEITINAKTINESKQTNTSVIPINFFEIVTSSVTHSIGSVGGFAAEIITDEDYSMIDVIPNNNIMVFDVSFDKWSVLYVGYKDSNDLPKTEILYAQYNFNSKEFNYKILNENQVANDADWFKQWWVLTIAGVILLIICVGCCYGTVKCCQNYCNCCHKRASYAQLDSPK